MFSVYGITGQVFSGTLEAMDRVNPLARARGARTIAQDGDEFGVEAVVGQPTQEAVRAYRAMLPQELERGPLVCAAQVMSRPAIVVRDDASAAEAWRTLHDRRIHQAPVLDDVGNLVGIVSERDLLTAIDVDGDQVIENLRRHVRDVMTTPVVGESSQLLGFVSRSDVLRAVIHDPPLSLWR